MPNQKQQLTTIQKVNPLNKEEEKAKFLFDPEYNPQFEYPEEITVEEYYKYGPLQTEYFEAAKYIIDHVIKEYGSETNYLKEVEGKVLSKEETEKVIKEYLEKLNLTNRLQVVYSPYFVSRTSIFQGEMRVRLPIEYREKSLLGVLDHELGTHFLRFVNNQKQPWAGQMTNKPKWSPYLETEEGFAIIHQFLSMKPKYMFLTALNYFASCIADKASFAEVYKVIHTYVDDPDRCWKYTLKIKRGLKDTSQGGAFTRNQIYFSGVIKVLRWLEANDFAAERLYLGKIGTDDVEVAKHLGLTDQLILPAFLSDKKWYRDQIKNFIKDNKLEITTP